MHYPLYMYFYLFPIRYRQSRPTSPGLYFVAQQGRGFSKNSLDCYHLGHAYWSRQEVLFLVIVTIRYVSLRQSTSSSIGHFCRLSSRILSIVP